MPRKPTNQQEGEGKDGNATQPVAKPLKPEYQRFVDEYLKDFNGTRAYMAAYPKSSEKAAAVGASRLIRNPNVQAVLAERSQKIAQKVELTQEMIFQQTARIAAFDIRKLYNEDGSLKAVHELDDDTAAAIAGLEVNDLFEGLGKSRDYIGHVRKYKIADKNSALERGARLLGLFKEDNAQRVDPLLSLLNGVKRSSFPVAPADATDDMSDDDD